jgi:ABC-type amino acid transport substrate-binding protein
VGISDDHKTIKGGVLMRKSFIFTFCVILAMTLFGSVVLADETMDRIEKTGKLRVGFREDSIPFAFIDPKVGKHVGFSVDMTYELANKLSEHFGKKIEVEPFTVTSKTRIPMVANATVDVRWVPPPIRRSGKTSLILV